MDSRNSDRLRCDAQSASAGFGPEGQAGLLPARALLVGVGGLGSWTAEQRPKALAAEKRLRRINRSVGVEASAARIDAGNIARFAGGVDLVLDGTDGLPRRFVISDYAVKTGTPWIFCGVVGAEGQTMTVLPGQTACLRCIYEGPRPAGLALTAANTGVLGPAVAALAAMQAMEALKILIGRRDLASPYLTKPDLWSNTSQRVDARRAAKGLDCPCRKQRRFAYLEPGR
jgi:adenylyltransferase/sulfurtransferase